MERNKLNDFKFILNEESFHKSRLKNLGASDFPILLGLSKFCTPYELWRIKSGRQEPFQGNESTKWGHNLEPVILGSYIREVESDYWEQEFLIDYFLNKNERRFDYKPRTFFYPFTEFYHPDIPWAVSHPDMIDLHRDCNIEAKSGRRFANIRRNEMDGFNTDCSDESGIPLKYYVQIQWQMLCSGLDKTILRALIDNEELSYEINANKKIQEKLIDIGSRFMFCLKKDQEPMPINSDDIKKIFPMVQEKTAYLIGSESEFANKMKDRKIFLSEKVKKYQDEIDDINNSLMILIGENKYLYDENNVKICSQTSFEKESISLKDLKSKKPDIYENLKNDGIIEKSIIRYVR